MPRTLILSFVLLAVSLPVAPAHAQNWASFGPFGGAVRRMSVAPSEPATAVALPEGGGLFLTTTAAATWRSIAGGLCDVRVTDAAFHPTMPATIYVATATAGICRSTDAGASWTALSAGAADATGRFTIQAEELDRIEIVLGRRSLDPAKVARVTLR